MANRSRPLIVLSAALVAITMALPAGAAASDPAPLEHACSLKGSGVLRYVANQASCNSQYEVSVSIRPGPTHVCAGPLGLLVRKVGSPAECGSWTALTVPTPTPVYFCAAVRIGGWLRQLSDPSRCFPSELALVAVNRAPTIELTTNPGPGDPFHFGDTVAYTATVTDDDPVDCSKLTVTYVLGHDNHGHAGAFATGCTGSLATPSEDSSHGSNLFALFSAQYIDPGGLAVNDQVSVYPKPR